MNNDNHITVNFAVVRKSIDIFESGKWFSQPKMENYIVNCLEDHSMNTEDRPDLLFFHCNLSALQMIGKKYKPLLCVLSVGKAKQKLLNSAKPLCCQPGYYDQIEIEVVKPE